METKQNCEFCHGLDFFFRDKQGNVIGPREVIGATFEELHKSAEDDCHVCGLMRDGIRCYISASDNTEMLHFSWQFGFSGPTWYHGDDASHFPLELEYFQVA